ncbi:hypothetical protein SERLA73DRAFT_189647, partial [Serpula lacrymans var. lacrymans S7.3]
MLQLGASIAPAPIYHIPRTYNAHPGSKYMLPADEAEAERFALQHQMFKRLFGGRLVYPPLTLSSGDEILDSGTGSSSWLLDCCDSIQGEDITYYAIDISSKLFPPINKRPRNTHHSVVSATHLPAQWSNKFTLVNQRLLIAALQIPEWEATLKEIYRVLIPGGWVQLLEPSSQILSGPLTVKLTNLLNDLFTSRNMLFDISGHLPQMMVNAGFRNLHAEIVDIPFGKWAGQDGVDGRDDFMGAFRGLKTPVLLAGGLGYVDSEA